MLDKSFSFLNSLSQNNKREWYHANKSDYKEAKQEFEYITEILLHAVSKFDKDIIGLVPKDCIFRIFRDIRFSADKLPYKTNFGAFITRGGKKAGFAGYYLHLEPGNSFIAGGIYMPPSPILRAIRNDVFENVDEFKGIIHTPELKNNFEVLSGEKLKNAPRGFPKDFPDVELLKFKSYGFSKMMSDKDIMGEDSLNEIVSSFKILKPFIWFLNEAIAKGITKS